MRVRRQTAEHPFWTIKLWMGRTHFLTKTLGGVSTEMSLHVLAYNLKRVIKILRRPWSADPSHTHTEGRFWFAIRGDGSGIATALASSFKIPR